jgi:hypothetical protein
LNTTLGLKCGPRFPAECHQTDPWDYHRRVFIRARLTRARALACPRRQSFLRDGTTVLFWLVFLTFMIMGNVPADLTTVGLFVAFWGFLDIESHWATKSGVQIVGEGTLKLAGSLSLLLGAFFLSAGAAFFLGAGFMLLGGSLIVATFLLQDLQLGRQWNLSVGNRSRRALLESFYFVEEVRRDTTLHWRHFKEQVREAYQGGPAHYRPWGRGSM